MKVLMINGSCHEKGCTYTALNEIAKVLKAEGIESEIVCLGNQPIRDCSGCGGCRNHRGCVFTDDVVHSLTEKPRKPMDLSLELLSITRILVAESYRF